MSSMYNRLGGECSPYLLQHAENPVHWFPWGEEAFEAARKANKVIFLSVGYSTCHWCHVMEKESFENQDIANILNEKFISIKVDREERPDVDKIYMSFVQATTGGGGWPMSVFLTPGLKPIFGGTYFPPEDMMFGRPGFKTILLNIAKQWQDRNHELLESGDKILQALQSTIQAPSSGDAAAIDSRKVIDHCFSQLSRYYDTRMGGFSKAPKFPQCVNFNFLLDLYGAERQRNKEMAEQALEMCLHTLDCMSKGGIYDHVSLGFARYSTDATWHVPHFEKMLYDQAQLVVAYSQAFLASDQQHYAHIVRQVLTYVTRDLMHPMGAFFSGEDADSLPSHEDSTKKEGAFCVWTFKQIKSLLKKEQLPVGDSGLTCFDLFAAYFNVQPEGNVSAQQDPHGELTGKNVLTYIGTDIQALQERFKIDAQQMDQILSRCKDILYQERIKRPRPHLDDKILTSWNGLMITALCSAGSALQDQSYIDTAIRTASFIRQHLYDADKKMLLRSVYNDKEGIKHLAQPIPGFLDDYAMLIQALLDLYSVCFDSSWMSWAWELQEKQLELFWDTTDQGFFTASCDDESLVMRLKDDQDGSEPAANSVAARNLIRLSAYLDKPQYKDKAMEIFQCFHSTLSKAPIALPEMVRAVMLSHYTPRTIIISGDPSSCSVTRDMIKAVQTAFIPDAVVILADGKQDSIFYENLQVLKDISKWQGKAFVCHNFACSAPVNTAEELLNLIRH